MVPEIGSVCSFGDVWEWDVGVGVGVDGMVENHEGLTLFLGVEAERGAERRVEGVALWNDPIEDFADGKCLWGHRYGC